MNKLEVLQRWEKAIKQADDHFDALTNLMGIHPEGQTLSAVYAMQDALTKATAELVGDSHEWLVWYWTENDMGARGHQAGPEGCMRPIRSLQDLIWLIDHEQQQANS